MAVDVGRLGPMKLLGAGGEGEVYELTAFRIPKSGRLAFKKVLGRLDPGQRARVIRQMESSVAFRTRLAKDERDWLDRFTAWPVALVTENRRVVGCLMPLLEERFFVESGGQSRIRNLADVAAGIEYTRALGISDNDIPDTIDRLVIVAKLVYAVALLHEHGRIFGDISLMNVVYSVNPPGSMLVDCDATADLTDQNRRCGTSPFFNFPEPSPLQDKKTDVYKLGLCLVRSLGRGDRLLQSRDPSRIRGVVGADVLQAVEGCLNPNPDRRPTAAGLYRILEAEVHARTSEPVVRAASLARRAALRGTQVDIALDATGVEEVVVMDALGREVATVKSPTDSIMVRAVESGELTLVVKNRFGTVRAGLGSLTVFDLPPFTLALPPVSWPQLPLVNSGAAAHALHPVPRADTSGHPVPRVPPPPIGSQDWRRILGSLPATGQMHEASVGASLRLKNRLIQIRGPAAVSMRVSDSASELMRRRMWHVSKLVRKGRLSDAERAAAR